MIKIINPILENLKIVRNLIYPKHIKCIFCGDDLKELNTYDACEKCLVNLPFILKDFCPRCGVKMGEESIGVCKNCKNRNYHFDYARAVFVYNDIIRTTIHKMKFSSAKYIAEPLANTMYHHLKTLNWDIDFITFIPLHKERLKLRRYNQAEELAVHLGKLVEKPVINCFEKIKNTPSQTSLSGKDRQENLKGAFKLIYKDINGKNILVIDDIFTTGATTNEVSKLLRENNPNKIYILTVAHTPEVK